VIRPGRDADADAYIALIGACWGEYPGVVVAVEAEVPEIRALATYMADHGGALWTAEVDGALVGMVATYPADDGWTLSRLYVDARQRGTGLAQDLLHRAETHARGQGATRMVLWSDVLFTRAHAFYEKRGYVRRGGLRALQDLSNTIEAGFAKPLAGLVVEELDIAAAESAERALATILRDCVADGASVSFLAPLAQDKARAYWHGVTKAVGLGHTRLFAAWLDGVLAGTVQLGLDMPENQPHRADLCKLLVAPASRRQGVAGALMQAAEDASRRAGRSLLVLDTQAGGAADQLYRRLGWTEAGTIPGYALDTTGTPHATRFFFKAIPPLG
jgi:GNAT superfamily N-acetyltransferase